MIVYTIKGMGEERKLMIDITQTVLLGNEVEPFKKYNGKIYKSKEEVDKVISELILDYNLKYIGEFNSYEDAQKELRKSMCPINTDLGNMVYYALQNKIESGDINKIIEQQIERMVEQALSSALCGYNDDCCSKIISNKLKEVMNNVIERYDFNQYLTKFTDIIDKTIKNSTIGEYKKLIENLKIQIQEPPVEIKMSELFKRYCDMIEKEVTVDYNSGYDIEEGSTYMEVEMKKDEESGEYVFKFTDEYIENDNELSQYTIKMSIGTDYEERYIITNVTGNARFNCFGWINSLRYAEEFSVFLMRLQQNMTKIIIDETEESDSVCINAEF